MKNLKSIFALIFFLFFENIFSLDTVDKKIYSQINIMTPKEKACQVLMLSIDGNKEFTSSMYKYFGENIPGAFILFRFNLAHTPAETYNYTRSIKNSFEKIAGKRNYIPPILAIDCEGGAVYRIKKIASYLPSPKDISEKYSIDEAKLIYKYTSEQIALLGIDLNLAPIVEIKKKDVSSFFGNRLYSEDEQIVKDYSSAFIDSMLNSKVFPAIKHFPGNANDDPHEGETIINVDIHNFYTEYVEPFSTVLKNCNNNCAVLISHVKVPVIEDVPFCFSEKGITEVLRAGLNFNGLILTDDLAMSALKTNGATTSDNAIKALYAGCDMIMCSEKKLKSLVFEISKKILNDKNFEKKINQAVFHILKTKISIGVLDSECKAIKNKPFNLAEFNKSKTNAEKILK